MNNSLLTVAVRRKKDLLRLRQRGRQIAALLGYEAYDQSAIAAGVFAIACQTLREYGPCVVHFQLVDNVFRVVPVGARKHTQPTAGRFQGWYGSVDAAPALRIEKPLPPREPPLSAEDAVFAAQHLERLTPSNLFEEIERQNQELLQAMIDLRASQAQQSQSQRKPARNNPSAA
jgi:hypothetical protein